MQLRPTFKLSWSKSVDTAFVFLLAAARVDPGGTPFSQLNKGVRDAMSATTKRDVEHQVLQKHAKGHRYQQSPNTGQRMHSLTRAQRRGLRWNPKESTYARVGRCNQRKRAWWNPKEAPMPEPEVRVRDKKGPVDTAFEYFSRWKVHYDIDESLISACFCQSFAGFVAWWLSPWDEFVCEFALVMLFCSYRWHWDFNSFWMFSPS